MAAHNRAASFCYSNVCAAAVLGGTLGVYGFNILTITGLNNQFGAGLQTFIGGWERPIVSRSDAKRGTQ